MIFYAQWNNPIYEIRYLPNGGLGQVYNDWAMGGSAYYIQDVYRTGITRPGFMFTYWTDSYQQRYYPGRVLPQPWSLDLYANWIPVYQVRYMANDGSGNYFTDLYMPIDEFGSEHEYYIARIERAFGSKSGFIFKYWNTKADGTGANLYPNMTAGIYADWTLYAIWESDDAT